MTKLEPEPNLELLMFDGSKNLHALLLDRSVLFFVIDLWDMRKL